MTMQIEIKKADPVEDRGAFIGASIGVILLFAGLLMAKLFLG
jgi:hypothetical protein